jgi:undecaprenyl-diphosphatase
MKFDVELRHHPLPFLATALAALLLGAFGHLASEVMEGETAAFDRIVAALLGHHGYPAEPWGPLWLKEAARDLTALGSLTVLGLVTALALIFLLLNGRRRLASLVFFAIASGAALSMTLKHLIARPRPEMTDFAHVFTSSFPSGHAAISAVVYLTLGALLAHASVRARLGAFYLSTAGALTLAIGLSRIYLGLHYPTDVAAGWLLGLGWALLWWIGINLLERAEGEGRGTPRS